MVLMAAMAAILIVSHCSEPPWNIGIFGYLDLENPKRAHFGRVRKIWIFECEDFIRRVWNWSSYRCKSCKPILSQTFPRPTGRAGIVKIFLHFCSDFCTFCLSSLIRTRWEASLLFLIDGFTTERRERGGRGGVVGPWSRGRDEERVDGSCWTTFIPQISYFSGCSMFRMVTSLIKIWGKKGEWKNGKNSNSFLNIWEFHCTHANNSLW